MSELRSCIRSSLEVVNYRVVAVSKDESRRPIFLVTLEETGNDAEEAVTVSVTLLNIMDDGQYSPIRVQFGTDSAPPFSRFFGGRVFNVTFHWRTP